MRQRQQERSQLSLQNNVEIKNSARNDRRRPWRTLRDDATDTQQLLWRRDPASTQFWCGAWGCRDQSRVFCTPSLAICPTHCSQLDLHPANLEATIEAKWILNSLSSCENGIFSMTYNYDIITYCRASIDGTFDNLSVTRNVRMICAKNCERLPKFFKLRPAKILSVLFSWHGGCISAQHLVGRCNARRRPHGQ